MARTFLVEGDKTFKIGVPDETKITFGPWSPPRDPTSKYGGDEGGKRGTLRVYQGSKENILACFSGVKSFRDLSVTYTELIAKEEGAVIWKSDDKGYEREEKITRDQQWAEVPAIAPGKPKKKRA